MKHLYIATPTYDRSVSVGYCQSLAMTIPACTRAGIVLSGPDFTGGPYIDVNRNWLCHRFLESDADTLLFIDADVTWDEKAVVRLYESGLDVVGGAYPKKETPEAFPVRLDGETRGGYLAAQYLPGGFLMIRRGALERLQAVVEHYPDGCFGGTETFVYFQNQHSSRGFCGEDVYFCAKWRELGGKVWLAPDIDFAHAGVKEWRGNYARHHVAALAQGEDGTRRAA